jgi:two-component sensor histidine kinase
MSRPAPHEREQERLAALRSYGILDTPREADFDDVVTLLSQICDVPFSTVTLIDEDRQWHKAAVGIGDLRETPRDVAFCAHTILHDGDMLIVPDVREDKRFADNPFVTGAPGLRFYAGAVLRNDEGLPLGTVCVVDYKPRELDARQTNILQLMARQVMAQIALRREVIERRHAQQQQQLLIAELHHRVKNTLATVQAVIQLSLRNARVLVDFRAGINVRIASLAGTHTLLSDLHWDAVGFRALIDSELSPYDLAGRVTLDGADFSIPAQAAVSLGMAIHELTTNASKYGALSRDSGKLTVSWTTERSGDGLLLDLHWIERGGPPVAASAREGFGSTLLRHVIEGQLRGKIDLDFSPEGLRVHARAQLPQTTNHSQSD